MVTKKIKDTILKNNLINSGEHIVIGLSGGPDSVCLFSVLKELSGEMGFSLYAVHVNHKMRPVAAEQDQAYVEDLCEKNGVDCRVFVYDVPEIAKERGLTGEEAGRQLRYESFYKVAAELVESGIPQENVKIAVAQNADDQAETVLFRLMRGTGTDGLAGMAYSRMEQNILVVRPLLDTWRKDIEKYCDENDLRPRTDKTNHQPIYTRNKIRLQLIPYLEENFNANIMEALNRLSKIAGDDKEYLWQQAEEAYERIKAGENLLDQKGLMGLPKAVRNRVIMKAFQKIGLEQDISAVHLENAGKILGAEGESREAEFPGGYRMVVRYGQAAFVAPVVRAEGRAEQAALGEINGAFGYRLEVSVRKMGQEEAPFGTGKAVFDYDKIAAVFGEGFEVRLRSRRPGDYLPMERGRKKLHNYFIDEKVPKELRENVQFAALGSEVLWIMEQPEQGIKKARYNPKYKLENTTKRCLILEIICEI